MKTILVKTPFGTVLIGLLLIFLIAAPVLALTTDWAKSTLFKQYGKKYLNQLLISWPSRWKRSLSS